jgi:hypothetical protein
VPSKTNVPCRYKERIGRIQRREERKGKEKGFDVVESKEVNGEKAVIDLIGISLFSCPQLLLSDDPHLSLPSSFLSQSTQLHT